MLSLFFQARFAAFRPFTTGSFRATAGYVTPSAAYGLILNLAGIEMRNDDGKSEMTLIAKTLPRLRLALGALVEPSRHSILQQLHNYPIGKSNEEHAPRTMGSKYNIVPVRREFLSELKGYICLEAEPALEKEIISGLQGRGRSRYGLPFLGDNNFLLDRLEPVEACQPAWWWVPVKDDGEDCSDKITRLTLSIDRSNSSLTRSALFSPTPTKLSTPPQIAWVDLPLSS